LLFYGETEKIVPWKITVTTVHRSKIIRLYSSQVTSYSRGSRTVDTAFLNNNRLLVNFASSTLTCIVWCVLKLSAFDDDTQRSHFQHPLCWFALLIPVDQKGFNICKNFSLFLLIYVMVYLVLLWFTLWFTLCGLTSRSSASERHYALLCSRAQWTSPWRSPSSCLKFLQALD